MSNRIDILKRYLALGATMQKPWFTEEEAVLDSRPLFSPSKSRAKRKYLK